MKTSCYVGGDVGERDASRSLVNPRESTRGTARLAMKPRESAWGFVSGSELLIRRSRVRDPPGSLPNNRNSSDLPFGVPSVGGLSRSMSGEMSGDAR